MKYDRSDYERLFDEADTNKDGHISYDELYEFLRKHGMEPDQSRLRTYYVLIDSDHNGKLDREEWCRCMELVFADQII